MDLNNFFDTGREKLTFKVTIKEGTKILKFFVNTYDKKEAKSEAKKRIGLEHPEMSCNKIIIEEVGKNKAAK